MVSLNAFNLFCWFQSHTEIERMLKFHDRFGIFSKWDKNLSFHSDFICNLKENYFSGNLILIDQKGTGKFSLFREKINKVDILTLCNQDHWLIKGYFTKISLSNGSVK